MSKRSKRFLTFLLCTAIVSNFGCATTTHGIGPSQAAMDDFGTGKGNNVLVGAKIEDLRRVGPSQAAMDDFGIGKDDNVLVRYANKDNPQNNPKEKSSLCKVFFKVAATIVQLSNITRGDATGMRATLASIEHYRSKSE